MSQDAEPIYQRTIPLGGEPAADPTPWYQATTPLAGPPSAATPWYQARTDAWASQPSPLPPSQPSQGWAWGGYPPAPPTPPEAPAGPQRQRGPAIATVALLALIAVVLGLTAGITIDRAIQDRLAERADRSTLPFDRTDSSEGGTTDPTTADPGSNGQAGDPGQPGTTDPTTPSTPGTAPSDAEAREIASAVTPALVNINTQLGFQSSAAAGTGMILTPDGKVLTNNHVIDGSTQIIATVVGTGRTYEAKVLGTAPTLDVALIQLVGASDLPTVKTNRSETVEVGDPVVAAGNAGGRGGDPSVVAGVVTALDQTITASDENGANTETLHNLIETDTPIQPGDSGGPLINTDSEVIGMNTAAAASNQFQAAQSVGYAIPIGNALDIVEQIEAGNETDIVHIGLPGIMGVSIVPQGNAALVNGVAANSPAERAGIQAGDTIVSIDGVAVTSPESLSDLMVHKSAGDRVNVGWVSGLGRQRQAEITLMEGPAD